MRRLPRIARVAVADIYVDARAYQFKAGDAAGLTDRLAGVRAWDPIAAEASPVLLHQRTHSRAVFIVDGHQRRGLALRLGVPALWAIVLQEADVTVAQARRIGARLNLQHGTGTALDVAKLLRTDPLTDDERAAMPSDAVTGETLRTGEALVALGPDAFEFVINGRVHPVPARNAGYGAIVGRLLPRLVSASGDGVARDAEQVAALARLAEAAPESAYHAEQFVRTLLADGFERGVQVGLFGETVVATSLAEPIAQILTAARRALLTAQAAFGGAVRHETRLTARGNLLNAAGNRAGVAEAVALDVGLAVYGHTVGPVRAELKRVAALVAGRTLTVSQAADAVLEALAGETPRRQVVTRTQTPLALRVATALAAHARKPFGPRGQQWIADRQAELAQEAG